MRRRNFRLLHQCKEGTEDFLKTSTKLHCRLLLKLLRHNAPILNVDEYLWTIIVFIQCVDAHPANQAGGLIKFMLISVHTEWKKINFFFSYLFKPNYNWRLYKSNAWIKVVRLVWFAGTKKKGKLWSFKHETCRLSAKTMRKLFIQTPDATLVHGS